MGQVPDVKSRKLRGTSKVCATIVLPAAHCVLYDFEAPMVIRMFLKIVLISLLSVVNTGEILLSCLPDVWELRFTRVSGRLIADDTVLPGHSIHGAVFNEGPRQQAYLMEGMGEIHFPVTTDSPEAQKFIHQGVAQLHGFWFYEAERSFRQAALLDPDCAMAYWGMAMANQMNPERMKGFATKAQALRDKANPRERFYLDSLQNIGILHELISQYPEETEAHAFLGVSTYVESQQDGKPVRRVEECARHLDFVLSRYPLHPCHHYVIHLWDKKDPFRALNSASRCGLSAPGIAHMWHMSGHLYAMIGRSHEAIEYMDASLRVDHRHMLHDRIIPDQIHFYTHNAEWFVRALAEAGRVDEAIRRAKDLIELPRHPKLNYFQPQDSSTYGRDQLLKILIHNERWEEVIQCCDEGYIDVTDQPAQQIQRMAALGTAMARLERISEAEEQLRKLGELSTSNRAIRTAVDKGRRQIAGHIATATNRTVFEDTSTATLLLFFVIIVVPPVMAVRSRNWWLIASAFVVCGMFARQLSDNLKAPSGVIADVQWSLHCRDLMRRGRYADALAAALDNAPVNRSDVAAKADLVAALQAGGHREAAAVHFEDLRRLAGRAQPELPCLQELSPVAEELGYSGDWRISPEVAVQHPDVSDLERLGPVQWQNWLAPDETVTGADGAVRKLSDYRGKPLILLFYLGSSCLHCVEQIQTFVGRSTVLEEAGLRVVGVSLETPEQLQGALVRWGSGFPFELCADPELKVFRAWRCYDEFENTALHGTFLVDSDGFVRWQDIGHEPFSDADFLIQEASRLLRFPVHQ